MREISDVSLLNEILKSWKRCIKKGVRLNREASIIVLAEEQLHTVIKKNEHLINLFNKNIKEVLPCVDKNEILILTDSNGVVLNVKNCNTKNHCVLMVPGIVLAEEVIGTNAVAMTIETKKSIHLAPKYNFCDYLENYYCYSTPIHSNKNSIVGCLAILSLNYHTRKELTVINELLAFRIEREYKQFLEDQKMNKADIKLSEKQINILILMASGLTEKAISVSLKLSINTVRYHKKEIFSKLKTSNSLESVVKGLKLNIISMDMIDDNTTILNI